MKKRVTMAQVAAKAGVSLMTVSRALRDSPALPATTRERIKRIAQKLGYRPDPAITELMARLRVSRQANIQTIAWITSHATKDQWRESPANQAIYAGAHARASELGYRLETFWLRAPRMSEARLSDILLNRGIRGIIIASMPETPGRMDLAWQHFASATCGFSLTFPRLHRACSQQFHAVRLAWDALLRLGYKRIGIALSADADNRSDGMWLASFLTRQQSAAPAQQVPPLVQPVWDKVGFLHWFRQHQPDAIVSSPHVLEWLREAGVRTPQDCAFAHLNVVGQQGAGVDHHMGDLGAAATDLVVEQLNSHRYGLPTVPKMVMVECTWCDGATAPAVMLR